MSSLLKYTVTTNPSPLYFTRDTLNPSITSILIAVTPDGTEDVPCNGIQFAIQLGAEDKDLTTANNELSIVPESLQTTWSMVRFSPGIYRAYPIAPTTTIKAGEVLTFQLQGILVNEKAGSTLLGIVANLPGGPDSDNITLTKVRSNLEINSFDASPQAIYPGNFSQLSWTTTAASSVTILPEGPPSLPTNGTLEVSPNVATTYYLTVFGEGPSITQSFPIQVIRAKIIEFTSTDNSIDPGQPVLLKWNVQDAANIEISPGGYTNLPAIGELVVSPQQTTAYSLKATNVNSEDQRDLVIIVSNPNPKILSFKANPESFIVGESSPIELSWDAENTTTVTLTPGNYGPLPPNSLVIVNPTEPTTYTLTATNNTGLIAIKQVTVFDSYTRRFYYNTTEAAMVYIVINCIDLPIGSAVGMQAYPYLPPPYGQIQIPKTDITTKPIFKLETLVAVPANTNFTFYVNYYPQDQVTPPHATIQLQVILYTSDAVQLNEDGTVSMKAVVRGTYPKTTKDLVLSQDLKL
ncbi:MAG: hypothetical protein AAFP19_00040 [Bacteroidota bacterium]